MAEYLIKSETMQAIADPIKEISGIETRITPAQVGAAAEEANTEVNTQANLMRQILTALNGKSVGEGGLTLPTLTNPGTADDLAKDKELIDENGNIVTGSVTTYDSHTGWINRTPSVDGENVKLTVTTNTPYLFRKGVYMKSPLSNFGDATAEDVAVGKTFTSASGLKVEGKHECSGGVDTSDATAVAGDIRWNKTAWVNGEKITGTLSENSIVFAMNLTPTEGSDSITLTKHIDSDCIILGGTDINCSANKSEFGDASTADVVKGKTFTSSNGLKITGTHECSDGLVVKSGTTTSATIDVGLSSLEYFAIYKTSTIQETGLINGIYIADNASAYRATVCGCSSYTSYSSRISNSEGNASWLSFDSGTVTLSTSQTQTALSSGKTYKWIAFGTE